jgi:predicted nucleic acid-binding protein
MLAALDTNVLAYAEGVGDQIRLNAARTLVAKAPTGSLIIPVQALGELFRVLVRKAGRRPDEAQAIIASWRGSTTVQDTTAAVMDAAVSISAAHGLQIWDAVMLAAAETAGAGLLLSEDLHDGFAWRGVTISNPFAPKASKAALDRFLRG